MRNSAALPYRVQYTDGAVKDLDLLEAPVRKKVQARMLVIASVDPYAHGVPDMTMGSRDRRVVSVDRLVVTVWVSPEAKILTVVAVGEGGKGAPGETGPKEPTPPAAWQPTGGEAGMEDDEEVEQEAVPT